jgi:mRNA interferase MazF
MSPQRGGIYLADLNPRRGTEPGKTRPVLVLQTDLLNDAGHPSTVVFPLTSRIIDDAEPLRVRAPPEAGLEMPSDILIDQLRAIDNSRLVMRVASLPIRTMKTVERCISVLLDLAHRQ